MGALDPVVQPDLLHDLRVVLAQDHAAHDADDADEGQDDEAGVDESDLLLEKKEWPVKRAQTFQKKLHQLWRSQGGDPSFQGIDLLYACIFPRS